MSKFLWNGSGKVLHDCPARVSTEFIATGVVELLRSPDQRHVPVANQLKEIFVGVQVSLCDGNDQPEVGLHNLIFDTHRLIVVFLNFVHFGRGRLRGIELVPKFGRFVLEKVEFAE